MTTVFTREKALESEIAPAVEQRLPEVEVLAVELLSPRRICVYVDHPNGVDHALCERVTRLLDSYRVDYAIDVSSPGPERPLRKRAHFASYVGRRVSLRAAGEIEGHDRIRGELLEAGEDAIVVSVSWRPEPVRVPYEAIVRANLIDEGLRK